MSELYNTYKITLKYTVTVDALVTAKSESDARYLVEYNSDGIDFSCNDSDTITIEPCDDAVEIQAIDIDCIPDHADVSVTAEGVPSPYDWENEDNEEDEKAE